MPNEQQPTQPAPSAEELLIEALGQVLTQHDIKLALICFESSQGKQIVFYRGELYQAAKLSVAANNRLKSMVAKDLEM